MTNHTISQAVQHNCNIADSHNASDYTLCVYLLKMREYYRWFKQISFSDPLPSSEIGDWISNQEQHWQELESSEFNDIHIDGRDFSVFDSEKINQALEPHGLVYSGGLGSGSHPHFFLGELIRHEVVGDHHIYVSNNELARDLTAPPAMSHGNTIFIRRESLRRMIWERLEEWRWKRGQGPMAKALAYYDFDNNLDHALEQMTDHEVDVLLHHEKGEIAAGQELGDAWHHMLDELPRCMAEFIARAVRDHIADCCSTLPMLIKQERSASIHFYFGNFNAIRKKIFPALMTGYESWERSGNFDDLSTIVEQGLLHWQSISKQILSLHQQHGDKCQQAIVDLLENNTL